MKKVPIQVIDLADKIGEFIEYWGFKAIHGRIWTLVFLAPGPVDASYLVESLKVSKALVSMSIKDLLHYDVILEVPKEEPGTQKYRINPKIAEVVTEILRQREAKLLVEIKGACELANAVTGPKNADVLDSGRLRELQGMVITANQLLSSMLSFEKVELGSLNAAFHVGVDREISGF